MLCVLLRASNLVVMLKQNFTSAAADLKNDDCTLSGQKWFLNMYTSQYLF